VKLDFDLANVAVTEFGVGRENHNGQNFVVVPVDSRVQQVLREMAEATWTAMDGEPKRYEPSEKHAATEYLYLPLNDDMVEAIRDLHEAASLTIDTSALDDASDVFCYFVRFTDSKSRRLTALRRASQFKGVLKSRNRLIQYVDDTLKIVEDAIFKLDSDFDVVIDSANVHIIRPSGFEFAGKLQQAILDAVPENVKAMRKELAFVDFDDIEAYAVKHPRAARCLASIRAQAETKNIDRGLLKMACKQANVDVSESKGVLSVSSGHEMAFLEVLDRRRYELELVKGQLERFKAGSRTRLSG
jgi:hypothetical protein